GGGRVMSINPMQSQTVTDANGDFTMDSLEAGDKTFVFTRSGYLTTQKSASLSGSETRVDAQLSSGTPVSGVVVTDAGVPVPDASVSAQSAADATFGSRSTRTDGSGNFQFDGLAPGRYTFTGQKNGYADGRLRDFDITTGAPPRIVLTSGGIIYGQVTGLTADELQRSTVIAQSPNGNASAPVDATGSFRIEGAPIGTVRVSANAGGGIAGGKSSPVQSVQVDAGSQVQVTIAFKSDTVISGHVTRNGQPVQGAMVAFNPKQATAQTRASTSTDSNGSYQVSGLDDADYNVTVVDIQRSAPYSSSYHVQGSGTFDVDMKAASLHGRVIDSDGNAVSDAMVDLRASQTDTTGIRMSRTVQTDASGAFLVDNVPAGMYSVSAEKQGYGTRAVDTTVDDSGGNVEITITKNVGVTLRVADARDGRLLNAQVHVTNAQGATVYDSPFFGGGSADAINLPLEAGSYSAQITAMGYAPQKVTINSPSSPTIGLTPGGTIIVQSKGGALRRARLIGPDGQEYSSGRFGGPIFTVDPSPGVTLLNNIAPGTYTLQILGDGNDVAATAPVTVAEGQQATVSI
ncbi:MAG TPA: carboxypeptidase regulatory-like domain-containing protein, partial [Thermoanaerobaculia bacterium]